MLGNVLEQLTTRLGDRKLCAQLCYLAPARLCRGADWFVNTIN